MDKHNDINNQKLNKKKRVKRLKKVIVSSTITMLAITTFLCVLAVIRVFQLQNQIDALTVKDGDSYDVSSSSNLSYSGGSLVNSDEAVVLVNPDIDSLYDYEYLDNADYSKYVKNDEYKGMKKIYLTFDDGPSSNTNHILDILDDYGIKATFFVNGHEGYDAQYIRIVADGHSIGMHSFSHSYKDVYRDLDSFADDLYMIQSYISDVTGVTSHIYRFPGGSSNNVGRVSMDKCISYLHAKDIEYFDWNVSAEDATAGGATANQIINNIVNQINYCDSDTIIVLMHDCADKSSTVEALPVLIEKIANMENTIFLPITEDTVPIQHVVID